MWWQVVPEMVESMRLDIIENATAFDLRWREQPL